ncbi:MAG: CYTH domain-containing protein [Clostridiales bacterium]|jgi:inorganic triphosphatase YgiF|nr:CYTH domain-containing protein [Clostridiales bacterium]
MSSEIEVKLMLPDKFILDKITKDEFLSRYIKDDPIIRETYSEYYDTPDWVLEKHGYILRVRRTDNVSVAALKFGRIDNVEFPGLFNGHQWLCLFNSTETIISDLIERTAPEEILQIVGDKKLSVCFQSEYVRKYTTLYLPDRVRLELSLDDGRLICENKSEPLYELGLELLYGNMAALMNFSTQLMEHFGLQPTLLTKQQRALRLIRSR